MDDSQGTNYSDEYYLFKPTMKDAQIFSLGRKTVNTSSLHQEDLKVKVPSKINSFSLSDEDAMTLASGELLSKHYGIPQDIEWAKDGKTGQLFVVQSRPETVHSEKKTNYYEEHKIEAGHKPILEGIAIGDKIGQGKVRVIRDVSKIGEFEKGEVLVTKMTDPDWVSIMRLASAIVTNEGGKVCHAAIIGRELGIPVIVGTGEGTEVLKTDKR